MRGSENIYPVSLILLYFACQYISGCFSPSYWRQRVVGSGGNPFFFTIVYLWFPTSVHRVIFNCALFIEPHQILYNTHGLTRHPDCLDYVERPQDSRQKLKFRFVCHQNNYKHASLTWPLEEWCAEVCCAAPPHTNKCLISKKPPLWRATLVWGLN